MQVYPHSQFVMLRWEFADLKTWHVYGAAYELGLLLPLLFSGDMSEFSSKGSVLSVELFLLRLQTGYVCSQLAWSTGRASSLLCETNLFCKAKA